MPNRVFVALGSNIDKERNIPASVKLLAELDQLVSVSSVYETIPIGPRDESKWPRFWNAAVLMETSLGARTFRQDVLLEVERALKRKRTTDPFAPRTIDADMVLFNQEVFDLDPEHHIPDPDLLKYAHVAIPIAEIQPDLDHPETGERISEIAKRLLQKLIEEGQHPPEKQAEIDLALDIG
jgi:2-amino-4-hydroxy-6-hydroxymethyldihydropteridine diphosphokinase